MSASLGQTFCGDKNRAALQADVFLGGHRGGITTGWQETLLWARGTHHSPGRGWFPLGSLHQCKEYIADFAS